jgi:hypothetical protein
MVVEAFLAVETKFKEIAQRIQVAQAHEQSSTPSPHG